MEMMKAFVRTNAQNGTVEFTEVPIPEINELEVLVKVMAFGVGIHDRYFIPRNVGFPYTIGTEAAGVITKIGRNVTRFKVGDRVIFTSIFQPQGGCWAQYVAVPQQSLILMPDGMNFIEGAAISVAGKSALESMRALDLKEGDTLFVAGASGAIGTLIIQLARTQGIRVAGSASRKNHEYLLSLGAEMAVDYADTDWKKQVRQWMPDGVEAVLAIQPGTGIESLEVVKDGGKLITVSGDNNFKSERNITVEQFQHHQETQQALVKLVEDIAAGRILIVIEQVYPFEQAISALEKTETRHARGKLVVSVEEA
jgi:NADPH:quinone reductase-like Zn-dependent oxidoreductase